MDSLKEFLREYHFLISGVFGGLTSFLIMGWIYKGNSAPLETEGLNNQVFRHSKRTRIIMYVLAAACFVMAALPAYALKYPDQWTPKLLLIICFGFGAVYCLLEVRRALIIIKPKSIAVSGAFSNRLHEVAYGEIASLYGYDTLQMLCIKTRSGKRLWISYMMANFAVLIERLNQRGLAVDAQTPALEDMAKALVQPESKPELVWFMLPFLSVWKVGARHVAVLARLSETGFDGYFVHYGSGTAHATVTELAELIRHKKIEMVDDDLNEALATDMDQILANKLAWAEI